MSMTIERPVEVEYTPAPAEPSNEPKPKWKPRFTREHLPLTAILLLSAFLGLWNLSINSYSNDYYAAAVKSMLTSWHNFFFVSFDPSGIVTVDKPPVAFWVQAAFAKVFGFSGVSILLPEALAGIGGVFLLYLMVKKAWGQGAGLIAALILAVTPIFVAMNRHNNPDSILVFTLLVAAWAMLRAAEKGKLRWLMLASVMVGVAFNVKMLEAYIVLPAFFAMYFLLAKTKWWKRIIHLTLAAIVIVAISLSWAIAVDLTPASERPYVDSSTKNSELDLILGYNGLGRITGNENGGGGPSSMVRNADGSVSQVATGTTTTTGSTSTSTGTTSTGTTGGTQGGFPGGGTPPGGDFGGGQNGGGMNNNSSFGGNPGLTRLVTPSLAAEFNWFGPLALISLIFMGIGTLFSKTKDDERLRKLRGIVLWGGWLLTFAVVFSFSQGTFHNYYLTIMAPAVAALAGAGIVAMWKQYRKGGWAAWILPVALAATAFYQSYILSGYTSWNTWLSPVLVVVGLAALVGLVVGRLFRQNTLTNRLTQGITWATMAALLVAPAALSVKVVFTAITGTFPSGTPTGTSGGMGGATSTGGNWLTFIQEHLGGQLIVAAVVLTIGAALFGLAYLLRQKRFLSQPALTGLLLVFLVVGSTGWWYSAAQTTTASARTTQNTFGGGNKGGNVNSELLTYLVNNQNGYANIVAVSSSTSAASLYLESDQGVISLGGFSGSDNIYTSTSQVEALVSSGTVRFFLLGGQGGMGSNSVVSSYVTSQCKLVDSSAYSGSTSASAGSTTVAATTTTGAVATENGTTTTSTSTSTGSDNTRSFSAGGMGNQQQQLYVCGS
jgi:4-amino-4-deoxy-L-arabinose transferase-like glycosyltransferase